MITFSTHFWERYQERYDNLVIRNPVKQAITTAFEDGLFKTINQNKDGTRCIATRINDEDLLLAVMNIETNPIVMTVLPKNAREHTWECTKNAFLALWNELSRRDFITSKPKQRVIVGESVMKTKKRAPILHTASVLRS